MPGPDVLPLGDHQISWTRFERFCRELLELRFRAPCQQYGRPGNPQRGIDLRITLADGSEQVFQCKQWARYTKQDAIKAIKAATYRAKKYYVLLSCEASAEVQDTFRDQGWEVWDQRDISTEVRKLPEPDARRLIEHHFGNDWRRAFLGQPDSMLFQQPARFLDRFMDRNQLFHHAWTLVGREQVITAMNSFVCNPNKRAFVLSGRGGTGKSRVLVAFAATFATKHAGWQLRFASELRSRNSTASADLPGSPCVIVIDDAHRRDDLRELIELAGHSDVRKFVVACRPEGFDPISTTFVQFAGDPSAVETTELADLSRDEQLALAQQALGDHAQYAERLAAITGDCPLVTVVGGRLLAERDLDPALLVTNTDFRQLALERFRTAAEGRVAATTAEDAIKCRKVLQIVSAIAPANVGHNKVVQVIAAWAGIEQHQLRSLLGDLERAGLLQRRPSGLRIIPDVLSDFILADACFDKQGRPTGFAVEAYNRFHEVHLSSFLRNLGELDWRTTTASQRETTLLDQVWSHVEAEIATADYLSRLRLFDALRGAAPYQPTRILGIVRRELAATEDPSRDFVRGEHRHVTRDNVLARVPDLLQRIAYSPPHFRECLSLLWQMVPEENSPSNVVGLKPVEVLKELISYAPRKPLWYAQQALEAISNVLREPRAYARVASPLDLLDPLLIKESHESESDGTKVVFRPFLVNFDSVAEVRRRALELLRDSSRHSSLRVVRRVVSSLEKALQEPLGVFGMTIPDERRTEWSDEQLEIIKLLLEIKSQASHPLVVIAIAEAVEWHSKHGRSRRVQLAAQQALAKIVPTTELKFVCALAGPNSLKCALRLTRERSLELVPQIAAEFVDRHPDPANGLAEIATQLEILIAAGLDPNPLNFLWSLAAADSAYAARAAQVALRAFPAILRGVFAPLLDSLQKHDPVVASASIVEALEGEDPTVHLAIADTVGRGLWTARATDSDFALLLRLLSHANRDVRLRASNCLVCLARNKPDVALRVLEKVEFGSDTSFARSIFSMFHENGISMRQLPAEQRATLIDRMVELPQIDDYYSLRLLSQLPREVVSDLLLRRIQRALAPSNEDYTPIPSQREGKLFANGSDHTEQQRAIRGILLRAQESSQDLECYYLGHLLRVLGSGHEAECVSELVACAETSNADGLVRMVETVVAAKLGHNTLFRFADAVAAVLRRAEALGGTCVSDIADKLLSATLWGERHGPAGEPFPQDVEIRDQATRLARECTLGTPEQRFFADLARGATYNIERSIEREQDRFA